MTMSSRVAAALGASLLLFATPVFAQTTAAPAAAQSATMAATSWVLAGDSRAAAAP